MTATQGRTAVLFIDDEAQMRRLVRASLERNGYDVMEAGGLRRAMPACYGSNYANAWRPLVDGPQRDKLMCGF